MPVWATDEQLVVPAFDQPSSFHALIHPIAWRNCLENSRRPLERGFLPPRGCRSTPLWPLLEVFGDSTRDPFRFSKQFRKVNSAKFAKNSFGIHPLLLAWLRCATQRG